MMKFTYCKRALLAISIVTLAGCQASPGTYRYEGFGNFERSISTSSSEAQEYFNQGMQLLYGFNHDEAIRSFHQAAMLDPSAPMPWWGIAYANGININDPAMSEQRSLDARSAADKALDLIDAASPSERALIKPTPRRWAWPTAGTQMTSTSRHSTRTL